MNTTPTAPKPVPPPSTAPAAAAPSAQPSAAPLPTVGPRLQRALTRQGGELVAFGIDVENRKAAMLNRHADECRRAAEHDAKRAQRPDRKKGPGK